MRHHPPEARGQQDQPVAHTHHEFGAEARPAAGSHPAPGSRPAAGEPAAPGGRPAAPLPAGDGPEELLAAAGYLGVIFFSFVPALVIYLVRGRSSDYLRRHAARAVSLSAGVILFDLSAGIVGALLALDTVTLALSVAVPLATALWLTVLVVVVRAALAAARGEQYELPGWLCVQVLK
jgi:uncharacterized protein